MIPKLSGLWGMFRDLCGESTLRNVVLVDNTWGKADPGFDKLNETRLMWTFGAAINMGAQVARNENTITSAQNIIRLVLDNDRLPPLRTRSWVQDPTVHHAIDNCSGEAYALSVGSQCPRSGHRVGFSLGFPLFALVTYVCRSTWSDSVISLRSNWMLRSTQFISRFSGTSRVTKVELEPRTSNIRLAGPFNLDGRRVVFIDTPELSSDSNGAYTLSTILAIS